MNGVAQIDFITAIGDSVTTPWLVEQNGQLAYLTTPNTHIADYDTAIRILWPFNYTNLLSDYSYKGNDNLIGAIHDLAIREVEDEYYGTYIGMLGKNTDGTPLTIMVAPGLMWSSDLQKILNTQLLTQGIDQHIGIMDPMEYNAVNQYWGLKNYQVRPAVMDYETWSQMEREIPDISANFYVLIH